MMGRASEAMMEARGLPELASREYARYAQHLVLPPIGYDATAMRLEVVGFEKNPDCPDCSNQTP